jgi:predicted nucleic-acid-binding Zn-ribbon protein
LGPIRCRDAFAQNQIVTNGGKLLNVVDIQDPEMTMQLASLD